MQISFLFSNTSWLTFPAIAWEPSALMYDFAFKNHFEFPYLYDESQDVAKAYDELRKRGYDAINQGDEIVVLNPEKYEVFDPNKQ